MAADEHAEYPAGEMDGIVDLFIQIAVAAGLAAGARRPFGGADGEDQGTGDQEGRPHLRPVRGLDEAADFALA
jgi:hypothetical protein